MASQDGQLGSPGDVSDHVSRLDSLPTPGISIDIPNTTDGQDTPISQAASTPSYKSPLRHHQRSPSQHREIKETLNAHSEYTNNQEDGKAEHHLNQYLIKDEIGRGSFGAVHLATDQYGTEFAVKEFSKSRLRKRAQSNILRRPYGGRARHLSAGSFNLPLSRHSASDIHKSEAQGNPLHLIKQEIAIMKKLDHPNLVSLIEVLDDPEEDSLYMVLEMCKKGVIMRVGLNERAEPYDVESCRCWFRDMILGIEYLHAQGVVHRDIKPDNLLITDDDVLKIVDFGVSEMFEKSSEMLTAKSAGSPAFSPPELCVTHHGDISGKAADIWSMGVSLYCLRFGRIPFERSGILDMYEAIMHNEVEYEPDCEPELVDLLKRILDKNPKTRITMGEMREHPWVTKNGEDHLLSFEENTANFIETPSENEVKHAITTKMGNLIVLMKAVTKFKSLLDKKRPASSRRNSGKATPSRQSTHELVPSPETPSATNITHLGLTASPSSSIGPIGASGLSSPAPSTQPATPRHNSERSGSGDSKYKRPHRILTSSSDKSHAHDILLDEPLYLGIGAGKDNLMAKHDALEVPEQEAIAESPQAADFNIYDVAYQNEVDRIRAAQGKSAKVFLNRRVDKKQEYKTDENMVRAPAAKSRGGGWNELLERMQEEKEKEKEKERAKEQESEQGNNAPSGS